MASSYDVISEKLSMSPNLTFGSLMKKRLAVMAAIVLAIALVAYDQQSDLPSTNERAVQTLLKKAIRNGKAFVALSDLTKETWKTVCMIVPYATRPHVEAALGSTYDQYQEVTWIGVETYWTLLFVRDDDSTLPVRIHRTELGDYNLKPNEWVRCAPFSRGVLIISKEYRVGDAPIKLEMLTK
jgi:hypothetical protein